MARRLELIVFVVLLVNLLFCESYVYMYSCFSFHEIILTQSVFFFNFEYCPNLEDIALYKS